MLSILMPAYNAERYLSAAIKSCVEQLPTDRCRVIVCDDASTDGTAALLKTLSAQYAAVRVIQHTENRGIGATRNTLLSALSSDTRYVGFLDSDDVYVHGAIAVCVKQLEENPSAMMVLGRRQVVHTSALETADTPSAKWPVVIGNTLCSGFYRTELIAAVGEFDTSYSQGDDIDYMLRMAEQSDERILLEDIIYYYRRHDTNVTHNLKDMRSDFLRALLLHAKRRALNPSLKDARGLFPPMDRDVALKAQLLDEHFDG